MKPYRISKDSSFWNNCWDGIIFDRIKDDELILRLPKGIIDMDFNEVSTDYYLTKSQLVENLIKHLDWNSIFEEWFHNTQWDEFITPENEIDFKQCWLSRNGIDLNLIKPPKT